MKRIVVFFGATLLVVLVGLLAATLFRMKTERIPPEARNVQEPKAKERVHAREEGAETPEAKTAPNPSPPAADAEPARPQDRTKETLAPGERSTALVGLDVEDPTSAELTSLKVPEGITGVVVKSVHPASSAAEATLRKNDVIVRAERDKIISSESLRTAVGAREHTLLTVYRDGYPFQVVLHTPFKGDQ